MAFFTQDSSRIACREIPLIAWSGRNRSAKLALVSALWLVLLSGTAFADELKAEGASNVDTELEQRVPGSAPMPRTLPSTLLAMPPIFVAADRVLLPDGSVDPSMFRPGEIENIRYELDLQPSDGGCVDMMSSDQLPPNGGHPRLSEVIRDKENTVLTEVTGRIYGYFGFVPGTLLRVETREVLKGKANRETYFIHFPEGAFEVGDRRICRTTLGFPSPPELGDRVLLLYYNIEAWAKTSFLNVRATDVVVLPQSGPIRFSSFFTSDFEKSDPVGSDRFLDFARTQLTQDLSEETEQ